MSETTTTPRTDTVPDPHDAPTERHDVVDLTSLEAVSATIEGHQGLRTMKNRARQIFEFDDSHTAEQVRLIRESDPAAEPEKPLLRQEKAARRAEKVKLLERFAKRLEGFRDSTNPSITDHLPDLAQREAIVERMIQIAETPEAYIEDTPALKSLLDEARGISVIYVGGDPDIRDEKAERLRALNEQLNDFLESSPIGAANKKRVVDVIWHRAERPTDEDMRAFHTTVDDDDPTQVHPRVLDREAEARRQEHLAVMERINDADRLHGYKRVLALGELAIELNNRDPKSRNLGFGDLGVIAATRIRSSDTRGPIGKLLSRRAKYSDYVLSKMALTGTGGNLEAAKAMAHGGYVRDSSLFKGRNDMLEELARRQDSTTEEGSRAAREIADQMRGLRAGKHFYDTVTNIAEQRGDPNYLTALVSMYDLYHKQEAMSKVAIAVARDGDRERARRIALVIKFPSMRNKTLHEINKVSA